MSDNLSLCGYVKVKGKKESCQLDLIQTPTRVTQAAMNADYPENEYYRYLVECEISAADLLEQIKRIQDFKNSHHDVHWLSDERTRKWT